MDYRNIDTGRVLSRPEPDEYLEASSGWERVADEPASEERGAQKPNAEEGADTKPADKSSSTNKKEEE